MHQTQKLVSQQKSLCQRAVLHQTLRQSSSLEKARSILEDGPTTSSRVNSRSSGSTLHSSRPNQRRVIERNGNTELSKLVYGTNRPARQKQANAIYVSTYEPVKSLAEAYAIVRAIERKYGPLREFRFLRDYEVPNRYQNFFHAFFHSDEALKNFPTRTAETLQVASPHSQSDPDEFIGLADLKGLLDAQERSVIYQTGENGSLKWENVMQKVNIVEGESEGRKGYEKKRRVLDVKVERAYHVYGSPSGLERENSTRGYSLAVGHAFLDWGGFFGIKPVKKSPFTSPLNSASPDSSTSPLPLDLATVGEVPTTIGVDQTRMRTVLTNWANVTGRPDPSIEPPSDAEKTGEMNVTFDEFNKHSAELVGQGDHENIVSQTSPPTPLSKESSSDPENRHGLQNSREIEKNPNEDLSAIPDDIPKSPNSSPTEFVAENGADKVREKNSKKEKRKERKEKDVFLAEKEVVMIDTEASRVKDDKLGVGEGVGDKLKNLFGKWF